MMNVIALNFALQSALALFVSHLICVAIVMYFDLTGKWDAHKLHKKRNVSITDYRVGLVNFVKDLTLLFVPFLAICFSYRLDAVQGRSFYSSSLFSRGDNFLVKMAHRVQT